MKTLLIIFTLLFINTSKADSVLASTFGYNPNNATAALYEAFQSTYDTIIVDLQVADWKISPLNFFNLENKTIIFERGVVVRALPGEFNALNASLFKFNDCHNITLIGYGATLKMNKAEYAALDDSEFRHSISLWGCSNFTIKGLIIDESGGDGISIDGDGLNYCENILVEDVQCINHYRQGMSIMNVQNMIVKNSFFAYTQGTLPEAGIDIEPYQTNQRIVNVRIENSRFEDNGWSGVAVHLFELDNTSLPVSVEVVDCVFKNNSKPENSYAHSEISVSADVNNPVQGNVLFERCFIEESDYAAFYTRKSAHAYDLTFKDCVFQNVSKIQELYNEPIFLEVGDYFNPSPYIGGIHFDNVLISYNTDFSFFRVFGSATLAGLKDITGNFTIVEPNSNEPLYSGVPDIINVNYNYTNQTELPPIQSELILLESQAIACNSQEALVSFERVSASLNFPLGISYETEGNVNIADDIPFLNGGIILPPFSSSRELSIPAREGFTSEVCKTLDLNLSNSDLFEISPTNNSASIEVCECESLSVINFNSNTNFIYPNPFKDCFNFQDTHLILYKKVTIQIFSLDGKKVSTQPLESNQNMCFENLNPGIYIVEVIDSDKNTILNQKIIKK